MKKLNTTFVIIIILTNHSLSWCHSTEIPYHCPSYVDIKFNSKAGKFYANTTYNGQSISWWSEEIYPRQKNVDQFIEAQVWSCSNNDCDVACKYNSSSYDVRLELIYGNYKITGKNGDNWNNGICKSSTPEACVFTVAPRVTEIK